jgi:hypothetical protein
VTPAILMSSRAGGRYLACLVGCGLVCALCSPYGLKIDWAANHPAVVMGVPELCAILLISVGVIVLRPRMWIIDRLGIPQRRWIPSTGAALATMGGPQLALLLAATTAPRRDTWPLSATTMLFLAALAVLVAPFIGALRAGSLTLLLYFALTITAQLAPAIGACSPLAVINWPEIEPLPPGKIALAVATTVAALAVTIRTLGRTMRTWGRDLDTA